MIEKNDDRAMGGAVENLLAEKEYDANKIAVVVPVYNRIEPDCELALAELERRGFVVWRAFGWSQIDYARCDLASRCLDAGVQGIFWVDADVNFQPDDVEKLIRSGKDFCCGVYPKKNAVTFAATQELGRGFEETKFGPEGWVQPIAFCGFGFVFTSRSVFEVILADSQLPRCVADGQKTMTPYFMPMVAPYNGFNYYLGEDYAFCERARRAGIQLWADTTIVLEHVGHYRFTYKDVFLRDDLAKTGNGPYTVEHIAEAMRHPGDRETMGQTLYPADLFPQ